MLFRLLATQPVETTTMQAHYHVVKLTVTTAANESTHMIFACNSNFICLVNAVNKTINCLINYHSAISTMSHGNYYFTRKAY